MSLYFQFVQFEFTHAVGPHAGSYVVEPRVLLEPAGETAEEQIAAAVTMNVAGGSINPALDARNREAAGTTRGVGGSDVLIVGVAGAPAGAGRARLLRRARPADSGTAPAEVPLSVLTYVKGTRPLERKSDAVRQLADIRFSELDQQRLVDEGLRAVNLAIRAYRVGAPDPYRIEVMRRDARAIRVGFGSTVQLRSGEWTDAVELPPGAPARRKRVERLRPAEAVGAVLSGASPLLEGEELLLRALIDLDHGRTRAAAQQTYGAMRLLWHELRALPAGSVPFDLERLSDPGRRAEQLAQQATEKPLDPGEIDELESIVDRVGELLDRWRFSGKDA